MMPEYLVGCVTVLTWDRHFRSSMADLSGRVAKGGSKGLRIEDPPQG